MSEDTRRESKVPLAPPVSPTEAERISQYGLSVVRDSLAYMVHLKNRLNEDPTHPETHPVIPLAVMIVGEITQHTLDRDGNVISSQRAARQMRYVHGTPYDVAHAICDLLKDKPRLAEAMREVLRCDPELMIDLLM